MNFPPWTQSSIKISLQLRFEYYFSCGSTHLSLAAARNTRIANAFGVLIIFKNTLEVIGSSEAGWQVAVLSFHGGKQGEDRSPKV